MTTSEARELCRVLYLETLDSLRVSPRLRKLMRLRGGALEIGDDSYPLARFSAVRVVSIGKAAIEMAETTAGILAGETPRGVVSAPAPARSQLPGLEYFQAGHPYPDEQSVRAADAVLHLLDQCSPGDLVLFLISGGGSALLEKPLQAGISLEDLRSFHQVLVTCGAGIAEINVLRKHVSAVKGGRLAAKAAPAAQVTIFVSDVPEQMPSAVASGPTMPDESTLEDCWRIAAQYGIAGKVPPGIRTLLESAKAPETPKPGDPCFAQSRYYCLLSNRDGIEKLLQLARLRGLRAEADLRCDEAPFGQAADHLLARLETLRQEHPGVPVLLVSGGEVRSPATGDGRGGRNQAFVLHCVPKIARLPVVVLSAGTDGIDGNSPAAGAIADGASAERAAALGLRPEEFLSREDSFCFFEKLNDAIVTGPTGTNVRDLRILLAHG